MTYALPEKSDREKVACLLGLVVLVTPLVFAGLDLGLVFVAPQEPKG